MTTTTITPTDSVRRSPIETAMATALVVRAHCAVLAEEWSKFSKPR